MIPSDRILFTLLPVASVIACITLIMIDVITTIITMIMTTVVRGHFRGFHFACIREVENRLSFFFA